LRSQQRARRRQRCARPPVRPEEPAPRELLDLRASPDRLEPPVLLVEPDPLEQLAELVQREAPEELERPALRELRV